jgi:SpoVK/Ycf46/Vps4 family AAA+-type ATPase
VERRIVSQLLTLMDGLKQRYEEERDQDLSWLCYKPIDSVLESKI